jgi:tRNA pseudouridine38-40 synthase
MCTVLYKLTISYDGTPFSGFQIQNRKKVETVQGELNKTLSFLFDTHINVQGSGRTDTGVHAINQVVHFECEKDFPLDMLHLALDRLLHKSISVKKVELAPPGFHARFSAKCRSYIYILDNSLHRNPFLTNRAYWIPKLLDVEKMKEACSVLVGHHDFARFSKSSGDVDNTVKTLQTAEIHSGKDIKASFPVAPDLMSEIFGIRDNLIIFYFRSKSFLRCQVRLMTGNLIEVGKGRMTPDEIKRMLQGDKTVKSSATNIPGRGLYLAEIEF